MPQEWYQKNLEVVIGGFQYIGREYRWREARYGRGSPTLSTNEAGKNSNAAVGSMYTREQK